MITPHAFGIFAIQALFAHTCLQGHTGCCTSVSLTPDGKWAVTGSGDNTARLWDLRDTSTIRSYLLQGHTNQVISVSLTPDGKWAVTGSDDNTARLWDLSQYVNS